jgi:single-stranded DNA-binding protein
MAGDNFTVQVGNLTDDPELRFTQNGTPVANFRLAVNQRVKEADGSWRDGEASFFKVNVWRDQAENVAESLGKGNRAVVLGRLRTRSWETAEGDKGSRPRSMLTRSPPVCGGRPPGRSGLSAAATASAPRSGASSTTPHLSNPPHIQRRRGRDDHRAIVLLLDEARPVSALQPSMTRSSAGNRDAAVAHVWLRRILTGLLNAP